MIPHGHVPPGLDLERLAAWLPSLIPHAGPSLSARILAGGKSNLTYVLTDGANRWVLRRPPLGHILATAHDMGREYRVLSALHDTAVPVPEPIALCTEPDVLGVPFLLMEFVEGTSYRASTQLLGLGPERHRTISAGLVDTLATLHTLEPANLGLADFGRTEGFLARQVRRWGAQMDASKSRALPEADKLYALLSKNIPAETGAAIVHGDYRLDNVLIDSSDRIAAVLDWEMAALGDPLLDLALFLVYRRLSEVVDNGVIDDGMSAPGALTEDEVLARYCAATSLDLSSLGFHLALASYKLAAIAEGIHHRHLHGDTVGTGFAEIGRSVQTILQGGIQDLARAS